MERKMVGKWMMIIPILVMAVLDPLMKIFVFSAVDLNADGKEEVILFVAGAAGDKGGRVILHQIGDEVYGYITDSRTLVELKMDGTYSYSDPTGLAEAGNRRSD